VWCINKLAIVLQNFDMCHFEKMCEISGDHCFPVLPSLMLADSLAFFCDSLLGEVLGTISAMTYGIKCSSSKKNQHTASIREWLREQLVDAFHVAKPLDFNSCSKKFFPRH
jgi:hypothetical protein